MKKNILHQNRGGLFLLLALVACFTAANAAEHTYRYFRWTPVKLRGPFGGNPMVQLAEFDFMHGGNPVSWEFSFINNPGGNSPSNEAPGNLIDGSLLTKWLDSNVRPLVFVFPNPTTVDGYRFATANDAVERDPVDWNLEGSNDNSNWKLIDVMRKYPTTTDRRAYETFVIPEALRASINNFKADPQIVKNDEHIVLSWQTSYAVSAEIDNGVGTVEPNSGTVTATPPNDSDTTYKLTVKSGADEPNSAVTMVRTVQGGTVSGRYLRFKPLASKNSTQIQLSELRFYDPEGNVLTPVGVENPGGNAVDAAEGAQKLYDGQTNTKWFSGSLTQVIFDFGQVVELAHYRLTTANDAVQRDPISWTMEASEDGFDWDLVENLSEFKYMLPDARFANGQMIPFPGDSVAPLITMGADFRNILPGEDVFLTWDSAGSVSVTGDHELAELGDLGSSGGMIVRPQETTTYTLTAYGASGKVKTASVTIVVVHPTITEIAYDNFDDANGELRLLGEAAIVNVYDQLPQGGDFYRLRLTPDAGSKMGAAWFRYKQMLANGFDSTFDFQFTSTTGNGADGMAFVVHNDEISRTEATPGSSAENGLPFNALNITFDSYKNEGEISAARIVVWNGSAEITSVEMMDFPAIALFTTDHGPDFTDTSGMGDPFRVKISYRPPVDPEADYDDPARTGKLYLWVNGVRVIDALDLTLTDFGFDQTEVECLDGDGRAWAGFTSRTGGVSENHDVLNWHLSANSEPISDVTGYFAWASEFPGLTDASPGGDPDGDGVSNLLEYLLGGNPAVPSTGILPHLVSVDGILAYSYVRRSGIADVTQLIEYSNDLVNWGQLPVQASELVSIEPNTPEPGYERVTVTYPTDEAQEPRFFVRLKAELKN